MPIKNAPQIALIADAGLGTRFFPFTKVVPKGLFPIGDAPVIIQQLKELKEIGVSNVVLVTNEHFKPLYEKLFSKDILLYKAYKEKGKEHLFEDFYKLIDSFNIEILIQPKDLPYGTGAPIKAAESILREHDSFIYTFLDDVVVGRSVLTLMTNMYTQLKKQGPKEEIFGIVAVYEVPQEAVQKYGVIRPVKKISENPISYIFDYIVEKPKPEKAPSNLASYGRFWFAKEIIDALDYSEDLRSQLKEYYIQPAMTKLAQKGLMIAVQNPKNSHWVTVGDPINAAKAWELWARINNV